ncbi:hypothetical protein AS026_19515 [Rhizobium altiplani]|uniref:Uncharacterized protein n=1 Tax=Rhizobium altiplani TaxID=1864509 RepID=A0A109J7Q8_9HYPH|nr:hypothetical protein [Rhizobium altiplani]KWV43859.1 hypothetical protein AS026_19515 [Rhizobium altiplani]
MNAETDRQNRLKPKTKTFGLETPYDLYKKLLFDIERLQSSVASANVRYAAFDCAVTANHIVDWVLHFSNDAQHFRLTGKNRLDAKGEPSKGILKGFGKINKDRLLALEFCRQIANSVKHVEVTRGPQMPNMVTGAGVRLKPEVAPYAFIIYNDVKYPILEVFEAMASQWKRFLTEEGFFNPDNEPDDE